MRTIEPLRSIERGRIAADPVSLDPYRIEGPAFVSFSGG